jgi:polar amino acid transport system substrate-binding protein
MKLVILGLLILSQATGAAAAERAVVEQLAPTGTLRIGVAYAPTATPVFAVKDAAGELHGVPRDLGAPLAQELGIPFAIVAAPNTGELTEGVSAATVDIGFMPVDDERRRRLDFSPPYFTIESTYLASGLSDIRTLPEVDRTTVTIVAIAGTTTIRAAGRTLSSARIVAAKSVDEAIAMMKSGTAQALALSRDSLRPLQGSLPGSRILDGAFQTTGVAIAVHKDRPAALAYVSEFVTRAKTDGRLRRAFDAAGLSELAIAP